MTEPQGFTCEDAIRLLADYLHGELLAETQSQVKHHLETCRGCFTRAEFERQLRSQLTQLAEGRVPPGLEERMRSLVRQFRVAADLPAPEPEE